MSEIFEIGPDFGRWEALLALILSAFAPMDGVIDPPSSAHRLTPETLAAKTREETGFVAFEGNDLVGCIFCRPEDGALYVGKLAVAPGQQGMGLGRRLLERAEALARAKGLPALRLETRIELTQNHAAFARWGFVRTGAYAHPGFTRITAIEMRKLLD